MRKCRQIAAAVIIFLAPWLPAGMWSPTLSGVEGRAEGATAAELIVPSPYPTIQAAVDAARDGDTVVVLDGTYTGPGNRDILIKDKAITVRSQNGDDKCLIDCAGTEKEPHRAFLHLGNLGKSATISGFRITGGWADRGGAIYCAGEPTITGNTIIGNSAQDGGGIACYEGGLIAGNIILWNSARRGGGIFTWEDLAPTIANNFIIFNRAELEGGGIASHDDAPLLFQNLIELNSTGGRGGGLYLQSAPARIVNCTILRNQASLGGGLACAYGNSPVTVGNSIIWWNAATDAGRQIFTAKGASVVLAYSGFPRGAGEVDGAFTAGTGCLDRDPGFAGGNSSLQEDSPCVDAGNKIFLNEYPQPGDLGGSPRVSGRAVDMGAYEYQHQVPFTLTH